MTRMTADQAVALALRHHQAGDLGLACDLYRQVLQYQPDHPAALHFLGVAMLQSGRPPDAVPLLERAASLAPNDADVRCNLGQAYRAARQFDAAETALRETIRLAPHAAHAHDNLGLLLEDTGRPAHAAEAFERAAALAPDNADTLSHLARALFKLNELADCVATADDALRIDPDHVTALTVGGTALAYLNRPAAAIGWLRRALARDPSSYPALVSLARASELLGRHADALDAHHRAIVAGAHLPDQTMRHSLLLLLHALPDQTPQMIADAHRAWAAAHADPITSIIAPPVRSSSVGRRLRIGYVSPDFHTHAVAFFVLPLLEAHDRARFEVFGYSAGQQRDGVTERMRVACDHWRDIGDTNDVGDEDAAEQVRADGIDILVDLAGHTACHRLGLFARRPAPIQVTYCGYPASTGMRAMDYRITDAVADPPGMTENLHSERLIRLPHSFLCYAPPPDAPEVAPRLPLDVNGHVTFGSFNRGVKITPAAIDAWCRILIAVPGSRLLLKLAGLDESETRADWLARFAARGVPGDRILTREARSPFADYLAAIGSVDVALDTFPYTGTTTTCEAMWMGVPVVTLAGQSHVSRVGLTLLQSVGLDDLAGTDVEGYVGKAVALANDAPRLRELRTGLRDAVRRSPLNDGARLAREIEDAYLTMLPTK